MTAVDSRLLDALSEQLRRRTAARPGAVEGTLDRNIVQVKVEPADRVEARLGVLGPIELQIA